MKVLPILNWYLVDWAVGGTHGSYSSLMVRQSAKGDVGSCGTGDSDGASRGDNANVVVGGNNDIAVLGDLDVESKSNHPYRNLWTRAPVFPNFSNFTFLE